MARIILLPGASSSGKTTLARALQAALPAPFAHLSFDTFRDHGVLPMERFDSGAFDWRAVRGSVFDAVHGSFAAFAAAGVDLIVAHILDTPGWQADLAARLAGHDLFFVGLRCDPAVLRAREAMRGDRPPGLAERDEATIHAGRRYDIEVDGAAPCGETCARVMAAWQVRGSPSGFFDVPPGG